MTQLLEDLAVILIVLCCVAVVAITLAVIGAGFWHAVCVAVLLVAAAVVCLAVA